MSHCMLFHVRINIHSKKKYKLASIAHRSCGNNRFSERSQILREPKNCKATYSITFKIKLCYIPFICILFYYVHVRLVSLIQAL